MIDNQTHTLGAFQVRCPHCSGVDRLWGEPLARALACSYARLDGRDWGNHWRAAAERDGSDAERRVDPVPSVDSTCSRCKKGFRIGLTLSGFKSKLPRARAIHQGPPVRSPFVGTRSILVVSPGWLIRHGREHVADAMGDVPPGAGVVHIIGHASDVMRWADEEGYAIRKWESRHLGQGRGPKNRAALKEIRPTVALLLHDRTPHGRHLHSGSRRVMRSAHALLDLARENAVEVREFDVQAPSRFEPRVVQ